jgi:hypothetical protein
MKCSIKKQKCVADRGSNPSKERVIKDEWGRIVGWLCQWTDLEETAKEMQALQRKREVKSAADLLRIIFAYAACDWSLRRVGAWSTIIGLGHLSDVAILKRLRRSRRWMEYLVCVVLQAHQPRLTQKVHRRLRITDGTVINRPGYAGTDWRLHIDVDVGNLCLEGLKISDARIGETFAHFTTYVGDVRLGDRGYAFVRSIEPVLVEGGWVLVRINWQNMPLKCANGEKFDLVKQLQKGVGLSEHQVYLETSQGRCSMRLVIAALPKEKADEARRRIRKRNNKGRTLDKRTILAAGFTLLLTNLPAQEWSAREIVELYAIRWQAEISIKRLKSILHVNHLRAKDPELAQVYILAKLLVALLIDGLIHESWLRCRQWFDQVDRPISVWRLTGLFHDWIQSWVAGNIEIDLVLLALPQLRRHLCDPPRRRLQQLSLARSLCIPFSDVYSTNGPRSPLLP